MGENYITRPQDKGSIHISEDALAVMARAAIGEVDGVSGLVSGVGGEVAERIGMKNAARGVKVRLEGDCVFIDVVINVKYGRNVVSVAKNVQESILSAVQSMTGIEAPVVNVHVSGIEFEKTERK